MEIGVRLSSWPISLLQFLMHTHPRLVKPTSMLTKAGHRSKLASLRFCVIAVTGKRRHTQVDLLWITRRFWTIASFPINSKCLETSVFTSTLPATKRKSRTWATRATDVIFERKHFSWRRLHTQVKFMSPRKCADKMHAIARKRWNGARIY